MLSEIYFHYCVIINVADQVAQRANSEIEICKQEVFWGSALRINTYGEREGRRIGQKELIGSGTISARPLITPQGWCPAELFCIDMRKPTAITQC